jgi:hypothetical protein
MIPSPAWFLDLRSSIKAVAAGLSEHTLDSVLRNCISSNPDDWYAECLMGIQKARQGCLPSSISLTDGDIKRFRALVVKSDGCWLWKGGVNRNGYGNFYLKINGRQNLRNAHRVSYALEVGDPAGLHVCHRCDNPRCVRPDHLFLGTNADNMEDMIRKGRASHPASTVKMTLEKANEMRSLFSAGASKGSLSRKFGISQKQTRDIINGRYWTGAVVEAPV